nr:MAG TPA: hypothetical protein [Caudoviricetes sp.]
MSHFPPQKGVRPQKGVGACRAELRFICGFLETANGFVFENQYFRRYRYFF